MPRFPDYVAQNGLDIGQAPQIAVDDDVAKALQKLGLSVSDVANRWTERQQKQAAFQASTRLDAFNAGQQADYDAYRQSLPSDGIGLHDGWMARAAAGGKAFLAGLTPPQQAQVEPRLAADSQAWAQRAAEDELAIGKRYEAAVLQADIARAGQSVTTDPSSFDQVRADLFGKLDQAASLGSDGQATMRRQAVIGLGKAWWLAHYGEGQPGGAEALGRPAPPAATTRDIGSASAIPMAQSIRAAAAQLGTSPQNLATVIAYETAGRFSPSIRGGKGNGHLGLIQFGKEERRRYGVSPGQSFDEQMGSVVAYLKDRGFKPGMGLLDLYSTINAGTPGRYDASDGHGTVRDHVERMSREQQANVMGMLAEGGRAPKSGTEAADWDAGGSRAATPAAIDPRLADLSEEDKDDLIDTARRSGNRLRDQVRQDRLTAQASLATQVEDAAAAWRKTGSYDGPLPSQADFARTYGAAAGADAYADFQRQRRVGQQIGAIRTLSAAEQDHALEAARPEGPGPGFAGQQDRYAELKEAIETNRKARAEDPNGYVAGIYPEIGSMWAQAGSSPQGMRAAISATSAAMTKLGIPANQRKLLPKETVSKAVAAFGDAAKPIGARVGPLRDVIAATRDPRQQQAVFEQFVAAGIPRLLAPAIAAYGRGDVDAAGRLLQAVAGDPARQESATARADAASAPVSSPLALRRSGGRGMRPPGLSNPQIGLAPSVAAEFARQDASGGVFDNHPLTVLLRDKLVRQNYQTNGGDYPAAEALARQDLRRPAALRYAQAQPKTAVDVPVDGGSVVASPAGPQVDSVSGKTIVKGPDVSPPVPANENGAGAPGTGLPNPGRREARSPLNRSGSPGDNRGIIGPIAGAIFDDILPSPREESEPYPDTPVPKSYSLGSYPFDKVIVTPEITKFILDPDGQDSLLPKEIRNTSLSLYMKSFNYAVKSARWSRADDDRDGSYHSYYTASGSNGGSFDISFAPVRGPNGEVTIAAVRNSGRQPSWIGSVFGDTGEEPGPWWGTPAPESRPEANAAVEAPKAADSSDDPDSSRPASLPPSHGPDDPYDIADYHAGLKAGLTDQAALAAAKGNYRLKERPAKDLDKNKTETNSASGGSRPEMTEDEPYDPVDYDHLINNGKSPEVSFEAAKELYQLRKEGLGRISLDGRGVTNPHIPKIPPPDPINDMLNPRFGKKVIKWGTTPDEALERLKEINDTEIKIFKSFGVTRQAIEGWTVTYKNDFRRNHNNYVALGRYKLMKKILEIWKE